MMMKTVNSFKKQAIITAVLLGFGFVAIWNAGSIPSHLDTLTVAQAETQTDSNDAKAPSPAGTEPKSKTDEEKKSTDIKKKPLRDFQPSEKIEAEQAVDFPYDI
jgi:predicted cobalt transporter CbtA